MKYLIVLCLFVLATARAAEPTLPASMSYLSPQVSSALQELCRGCTFADAGGPWNPSDVITENSPPQRRLVSIDRNQAEWRVQYEHGGRGKHSHTITFSTSPTVHVVSTSTCMPSEKCREW